MKILLLSNDDAGLWKFRGELIERISREYEVYICVPFGKYVCHFEELGCRYVSCDYLDRRGTNIFIDIKLIQYYEGIIREIRPDIVFTYTIKPNVYGGIVCARQSIPYVSNVTGLGTAIENGGLMQRLTLALYKMGVRRAQKVFFQNAENQDFMVRHHVVKGPYDLLPGSGVNLEQFSVQPFPEGDSVDFVFIARIMKEKGIDQYLDAAKMIKERHPNTRFHVCGFCEQDYSEILNELDKNGTICYHGIVDDMRKIYKIASCIIHPTYYPEGMSNVLLESLASGRPIITTNRSGCREVVEDGVNGYIVQQQDSMDLIDKIEVFLSLDISERKKMGLEGRKKVEREFDRQIVVGKYLDEIKFIKDRK